MTNQAAARRFFLNEENTHPSFHESIDLYNREIQIESDHWISENYDPETLQYDEDAHFQHMKNFVDEIQMTH